MKVQTAAMFGALLALPLGGCSKSNVYDVTPDQAYAKLIQLEQGTPAVIEVDGVSKGIYGTPGKSVTWVTEYAHSYYECTAYLTSEGAMRTSINVGCSDENAPAKFAMKQALVDEIAGDASTGVPVTNSLKGVRNRYIELVDSTLDGRSFDAARANSRVMGWPEPPIS